MSKLYYDDLIGKTFKWGGRGPEQYDCGGLMLVIYGRLGKKIPFYSTTRADIINDEYRQKSIQEYLGNNFEKIEIPEPFCAVALASDFGEIVNHVGVVLEDCRNFIHIMGGAINTTQVIVSKLNGLGFSKMIRGYWRLKNDR